MIKESDTVLPCMCFEYDALVFRDPAVLKAFNAEFNYRPVTWKLAHDVAAHCRTIQQRAKAFDRPLTQDEQTIVAIGRAIVLFVRQTILGTLTEIDRDVGF